MPYQLHDAGVELLLDHFAGDRSIPQTWRVGLYHDGELSGQRTAGDYLADDATHDDITTEPTYDGPVEIRHPEDVQTEAIAGGDLYVIDITAPIEFDVAAASTTVDGYYVSAEFRSEWLGQVSPRENLLWTGALEDPEDLSDDASGVFPLEGVRYTVD